MPEISSIIWKRTLSVFYEYEATFRQRLNQASSDADDRPRTVHPSIWRADRCILSVRPSHGRIWTVNQGFFLVSGRDFCPDRPPNGRIWTSLSHLVHRRSVRF